MLPLPSDTDLPGIIERVNQMAEILNENSFRLTRVVDGLYGPINDGPVDIDGHPSRAEEEGMLSMVRDLHQKLGNGGRVPADIDDGLIEAIAEKIEDQRPKSFREDLRQFRKDKPGQYWTAFLAGSFAVGGTAIASIVQLIEIFAG